jgi:dimethylglycine dehydrogenase
MGANFGLEHALWFAPQGVAPVETPTYRRSEAFQFVREECRAVRRAAGLYETSNYGKYEVSGAARVPGSTGCSPVAFRGPDDWVSRRC